MSKRRPTPSTRAHVPSSLVFDPKQLETFGTPQELEANFVEETGSHDIRPDYIEQINRAFAEVVEYCISARRYGFIERWTDVLNICVSVEENAQRPDDTVLAVVNISVRPCFEGNGILAVLMYQMLLIALFRGDVRKIVVVSCVAKSLAILKRKFGQLAVRRSSNSTEIRNVQTLAEHISAESLGIALKIDNEEYGVVNLNPAAFPTAYQLNSEKWVEENAGGHLRRLAARQ